MFELTESMKSYLSCINGDTGVDNVKEIKKDDNICKVKKSRKNKKYELKACFMEVRYKRFINTMQNKGLDVAIREVKNEENKATRQFISKKFRDEYKLDIDFFS